jgi:hypothetical protein
VLLVLSLKCSSAIPHKTKYIAKITDSNKYKRKGKFNKKRIATQVLGAIYQVRKAPRPKSRTNQKKRKE